ncbi:MAG: DnaJ domain-containing protein [Acidobacteria bacterium]|nr:DnaJ domain-containing protein [Acidobacteriota bacterium]
MVNYYDILKVSPKASGAEVKSAYRRLARKLHPDRNNGSEETALKFAAIAEAYEVLGNAKERARYDQRLLEVQYSQNGEGDSVFTSTNRHAKRWRQMVYEKRYNDIIDRMIAEERREAMAFQKAIYPLVALLVTVFLATLLKPRVFGESAIIGKIIIVSLFAVGVIHLIGRLRDGFIRYTEPDDSIHDSVLDETPVPTRRFSRVAAGGMLVGALIVLGVGGTLLGTVTTFSGTYLPHMFYVHFPDNPINFFEFVFYPPIITFFVDLMHSVASGLER